MSDISMVDSSLIDSSAIPGFFPSFEISADSNNKLAPGDSSQKIQRATPLKGNILGELNNLSIKSVAGTPTFNFRIKKPLYPNVEDLKQNKNLDESNKENNGNNSFPNFKFASESEILLQKKFSKKLTGTLLNELNSRVENNMIQANSLNDISKGRRLSNRQSPAGRKLFSPRSQVSSRFQLAHRASFNKMQSIKSHYAAEHHKNEQKLGAIHRHELETTKILSNHDKGSMKKHESGTTIESVQKRRKTLLGPEEMLDSNTIKDCNNNKNPTDTRKEDERNRKAAMERLTNHSAKMVAAKRESTKKTMTTAEKKIVSFPSTREFSTTRTTTAPAKPTASHLPRSASSISQITVLNNSNCNSSTNFNANATATTTSSMRKLPSFCRPTSASLSKFTNSNDQHSSLPKSTTLANIPNHKGSSMKKSTTSGNLRTSFLKSTKKEDPRNLDRPTKGLVQSTTLHNISSYSGDNNFSGTLKKNPTHTPFEKFRPTWK
ncbi:hypothetical protein PACTADRAFT_33612 [Pachysolen tannophilus NRRL Y-2460]|uniref:Uncharacterized protein n=1 Tax=Pachysolen tannophilus NRRL Y-2460 TaxID=669874 RepID=A0A1E4TXD3_PACTA|nr:hypothetical protein PACTADRAFT_33612 [Pachysolen tannophilus NRRL Y-2460]